MNPIRRDDYGAIVRLVLNSPANFNALSCEMIAALRAALVQIARDDSIRVVVIAAEGKAFCAGHDIRQMQQSRQDSDGGRAAFQALFADCSALMMQIAELPQPVIAEVQGIATAAGCQLVASCDLALAADGVKFGVNGVNIGLFCATPMVALTRAVPPKAAFEMLTCGSFISAERAREIGLINHVTPADDLSRATMTMAETIAAKLPAAVRIGKAAFRAQQGLTLQEAYDQMSKVICDNLMLEETDEGLQAFLEKRPPNWA
ncbi:enoyl-CoA hydratase [Paracoccus sp. (in: a-proteobacteria)]|uniref:enoyl-CoA hydratase n=1 Tax=Paracoccus sp. TaxID=267 RepID=UPI0028993108|nr:enoyl-CoA hydratase [Paracoccus sp. (in: a-proteobacteria)]